MIEKSLMNREFTLTRVFDAPRELVWKAHTELEHLENWWGPSGFTLFGCTLDLRPGGVFHYGMRGPDGMEMWGRFIYREIVAPEKLAYVVSFSDPTGAMVPPPFPDPWPVELLNTVTFTELAGKTTIDLRVIPIEATEEERATFAAGFDSMDMGYGGTYDQLADFLQDVQKQEKEHG